LNKEDIVKELYPEDKFFYAMKLTQGELEVLQEVRKALETYVKPVLTEAWEKAEFPYDAFNKVAEVGIMDDPKLFENSDRKHKTSALYNAFLYLELARCDASIATFYTVHGGLGYNTILLGGNERQINEFAPKIRSFEYQTCFGLTEPDHGSDIAGGLATTAERKGDTWILNGEKRWIGGASTADIIPIFARDVEDEKIKCFIVRKGAKGYKAEKIEHKTSLRILRNDHITLENVEVPENDRLENIHGFRDVSKILVRTRADIAHLAMGVTAGSFNAALENTMEREQFGKSIASFQLIQEKLSRMQANVVASIGYSVRLAELQENGTEEMFNSALSKMHNALRMRENVSLAREVVGGNGITLEKDVARFFADAEGIYTYEGTHEVNALIVGRELVGKGAFV